MKPFLIQRREFVICRAKRINRIGNVYFALEERIQGGLIKREQLNIFVAYERMKI